MKKILFLIFLALYTSTIIAQRKKGDIDLRILILSPGEIIYDKSLSKEINYKTTQIKNELKKSGNIDKLKSELSKETLPARKVQLENDLLSLENLDFFNLGILFSTSILYMVNQGAPTDTNTVIIFKENRASRTISALQNLAETENLQYVLNFSRIELEKKENKITSKVSVQFYNSETKQLLLDSIFSGAEKEELYHLNLENLPLECNDNLECSYYNALSKGIGEIVCSLNCKWIAAANSLENARRLVLINEYYTKPFDKEVLRKVLPENDTTIDINIAYQCFFNPDSTKFIAFFLQELTDSISIAHIKLEQGSQALRIGLFEISGVKYKDKWYYNGFDNVGRNTVKDLSLEESRRDHFNELQDWKFDFFKEESTEFNPAFWETKFFSKITGEFVPRGDDPRYDEETERNLLHYKGLHYVVAKQLREERKSADKIMKEELLKKYMNPLMEKLQLDTSSKCSLIYTPEKKIFIYPIKDKKNIIRYFVFVHSVGDDYKTYEWKYMPSKKSKIYLWQYEAEKEIKKLASSWSWRLDYLEDENFWNKYVLLKQGNTFKYLVPIK